MKNTYRISDIFGEYKDRIYRLAITIVKNKSDAEDVVQNAFLKIIENISRFRGKSKLSSWIYKIALNEALMKLRHRRYEEPVLKMRDTEEDRGGNYLSFLKDKSLLPDEEALKNEFGAKIENAMRDMPIKYRLALLLKDVENFPDNHASKILNLKLNTFKTRLHRARFLIKEAVRDYLKDKKEKARVLDDKKCGIYMGFVNRYVDEKLPRNEKTSFDAHIKDCAECNEFLSSYRYALRLTKALQCKDIPPDLQRKIEAFVRPRG